MKFDETVKKFSKGRLAAPFLDSREPRCGHERVAGMELEPRDGETIGLPLVFPSRRFFTKMDAGRCEGSIEAALLAPALLASELWQVLPCLVGWCLPTADCLPENGRRRRFSAAPRAPWFQLRPTPRVSRSRGS